MLTDTLQSMTEQQRYFERNRKVPRKRYKLLSRKQRTQKWPVIDAEDYLRKKKIKENTQEIDTGICPKKTDKN